MTGPEIRAAREKRKLTQAALAKIIGVDPMTVSRWEREAKRPSNANYKLLALWKRGRL